MEYNMTDEPAWDVNFIQVENAREPRNVKILAMSYLTYKVGKLKIL